MTSTPRAPSLRLIFESHATSLDNEVGLASGWFDVALSTTGEEQARTLGARRRNDHLAVVFCSDLSRSFRTAEIAFGDRSVSIVRDARLRECDYGDLTRQHTSKIEQRRQLHLVDPFPNGESYQQVVDRVSGWLSEVLQRIDAGTALIIGHRATYYALEHLLNQVTLHKAVTSPWRWQPGWTYHLPSSSIAAGGFPGSLTPGSQA
jgi:broad specificity phosphatase PhoE